MKLLFENWRQYLKEKKNTTYYWQTRGPWKSDSEIEFGTTHVPRAKPRPDADGLIEKIFEEVRKKYAQMSAPSRLNCVFLCDSLEGGSYCRHPAPGGGETYKVELRLASWHYKPFKTNSEYWTEAVRGYERRKDEDEVRSWAKAYWEGDDNPTFGEILVSPPEAAIIVGKYENETPI